MPQQYMSRYFKPKEDNTNQGTDTTDSRNRVTYRSRTATGKSTTEKVSEALTDCIHVSKMSAVARSLPIAGGHCNRANIYSAQILRNYVETRLIF